MNTFIIETIGLFHGPKARRPFPRRSSDLPSKYGSTTKPRPTQTWI